MHISALTNEVTLYLDDVEYKAEINWIHVNVSVMHSLVTYKVTVASMKMFN